MLKLSDLNLRSFYAYWVICNSAEYHTVVQFAQEAGILQQEGDLQATEQQALVLYWQPLRWQYLLWIVDVEKASFQTSCF